ncbi:MAG: hypothetical protein NZ530_06755 [Thermodesulfobacteriaceae bacterium]|nr:hypothetical protein [Thermodesulfobacteriaceae bacterium]
MNTLGKTFKNEKDIIKMKPRLKRRNLRKLKPLFWDYDWNSVENNLESPFVIARVLELANPEQFRVYSSLVGDDEIKNFLEKKGQKLLSKRAYNYWKLYYEKKIK